MNALQQKINYLDAQIAADKVAINLQLSALKKQISTPQFLIPALLGSLCLGYFMPHRKHIKGTLPMTLIKNIQTLLPMLMR